MTKKKSPKSVRIRNSTAEFLTFAYQTGGDGVEVRVQDGTIWLSQKTSSCSLQQRRGLPLNMENKCCTNKPVRP